MPKMCKRTPARTRTNADLSEEELEEALDARKATGGEPGLEQCPSIYDSCNMRASPGGCRVRGRKI